MLTHVEPVPEGVGGSVGAAGGSETGSSAGVSGGVATTGTGVATDGELGVPLHHAVATAQPTSKVSPSVRGEGGGMIL